MCDIYPSILEALGKRKIVSDVVDLKFYLQSQEIQRLIMFSNGIIGVHSGNFSWLIKNIII